MSDYRISLNAVNKNVKRGRLRTFTEICSDVHAEQCATYQTLKRFRQIHIQYPCAQTA